MFCILHTIFSTGLKGIWGILTLLSSWNLLRKFNLIFFNFYLIIVFLLINVIKIINILNCWINILWLKTHNFLIIFLNFDKICCLWCLYRIILNCIIKTLWRIQCLIYIMGRRKTSWYCILNNIRILIFISNRCCQYFFLNIHIWLQNLFNILKRNPESC